MDFRQFRYFVTAAEELHFARAAERLNVAQPAMSQQIKVLEDQLGVLLFSRAKKRVELTEAGVAFLIEAKAALANAEKAIRVAQDTARGESGKINIGFVGSVMYKPEFPLLLRDYRTQHPDVKLVLHEMPILPQIDSVDAQHMDIGIVRGPLPPKLPDSLATFVLARQRMVAVLHDQHPLAHSRTLMLPQLAQDPFLAFEDTTGVGLGHALVNLCRKAGFEPDIRLRLSEIATLVSLVGAGHGVSIIPEAVAHLHLPNVHYVPFSDIKPHSELLIVYRKFERSAAVKSLLTKIRESVPL